MRRRWPTAVTLLSAPQTERPAVFMRGWAFDSFKPRFVVLLLTSGVLIYGPNNLEGVGGPGKMEERKNPAF